eukprot:scaffold884_cov161-Isochrysis_galbana.AAC.4
MRCSTPFTGVNKGSYCESLGLNECRISFKGSLIYGYGVGLNLIEGGELFVVIKLIEVGDDIPPCYHVKVSHTRGGGFVGEAKERVQCLFLGASILAWCEAESFVDSAKDFLETRASA